MASRRILVVDDDRHTRDLLVGALRSDRYDVWEVAGGKEALEVAESFRPEFVVLAPTCPGSTADRWRERFARLPISASS